MPAASVISGSSTRTRDRRRRIRADERPDATRHLIIELVAAAPLLDRMWELRQNLTGYGAAYVALAETYDCALLTADQRLVRAPDVRCLIRLASRPE